MKTQDIKNMASAYMQVLEKAKMDPVNPDELKGTHAQRKDKDINNDGKVDSSDEYLHARRKAVSSAIKGKSMKEEVDYPHMMYHSETGKSVKVKSPEEHNMYAKKGYTHDKPKMDEADMRKKNINMSMKEKLQLQKESILEKEMTDAEMKKREDIVKGMKKNKAEFEKRYGARAKNVMYATATKQAMESVDNALSMTKNFLTTKETFSTETTDWPVYARIKENRAMQTKGATPPETMDDKLTASDKAFLAPHGELKGNDSGIDGAEAAEYTAKNTTTGIKPGGGMNRTGDQKTGDKNIIKSTEAK